jgi:hypothetical protein
MYDDFKDLIALLNKHKVKYLIVGGYAVGIHAQPRATKDLDILILPAPRNAKAIFNALKEFGAPLRTKTDPADVDRFAARRPLSPKDFQAKDGWFMMGQPPIAIDILAAIPGVTFATAWRNRVTHTVDQSSGLTAEFVSRDDLIKAKTASKRPQDLADVQAILDAEKTGGPDRAPKPNQARTKAKNSSDRSRSRSKRQR